MRYWLVMPAAGSGSRFGGPLPKQYAEVAGRSILEWALEPFVRDARCAGIVVALAAGDRHWSRLGRHAPVSAGQEPADRARRAPAHAGRAPARIETVQGGADRGQSVRRGLAALAGRATPDDWVLVHDAARPCLAAADLDRLIEECREHPVGGLLAAPVADTLKQVGAGGAVERTIDRAGLWRALTPQMFRYGPLCAALDAAFAAGRSPTDEAQALEWTGADPLRVEGAASNVKVTTAEDLALAAALLERRSTAGASAPRERSVLRIGSGLDVHRFGPGEFVMLGGVRVPHSRGVIAHSDGDVVLHALCDALLGASGLGDIGQHFRDDDPRWRGVPSSGFVTAVMTMLEARGLEVVNADVTLIAEAPRLSGHRDALRAAIAQLLRVPAERVNIKATTTERLGFLGRGEGIAAEAVVLLDRAREEGARVLQGGAQARESST